MKLPEYCGLGAIFAAANLLACNLAIKAARMSGFCIMSEIDCRNSWETFVRMLSVT